MTECEDIKTPQELLIDDLYSVCESAMKRADRWQEAMKVFLGLHELGIKCSPKIFNALLDACSRDRNHQKALEVFAYMLRTGVLPDINTYNTLVDACVRDGEILKALKVFEWMVEGRGASGPVPANAQTFGNLLRACHRKAMFEKSLEIMSWMVSVGLEIDMDSYDEVIHCAEVSQLWDEKVMKSVMKGIAVVPPENLRPSLFDGMRMLYTDKPDEVLEDTLLSLEKLGNSSWVPPGMRIPQTEVQTIDVLATKLTKMPWTKLLQERQHKHSRKHLPDARNWKCVGFSTKVPGFVNELNV